MFIFDRCCRSSAAVTPVKYECDANNLTGSLTESKILLTEKLTPTPEHISLELLDGFSPSKFCGIVLTCSASCPFDQCGLAHVSEHIFLKPLGGFSCFKVLWNCLSSCSCATSWSFAHLTHMGFALGQNAYPVNHWMYFRHSKFCGIIIRSCWGVYWFHSVCPSVPGPSRITCPLCSAYSSVWIHFIFTHHIKQLQKVCFLAIF